MSRILITGGAGFIGSQLTKALIKDHEIIVIDDFNNYYPPETKRENIKEFLKKKEFTLLALDIRDRKSILSSVMTVNPDVIVHLAARCGVRNSLKQEDLYYSVNVQGTKNILDAAKKNSVSQIIFASSSSVYGNRTPIPFKESARNLTQGNPYGVTKYKAEKLCLTYIKKYNLPILIFRFFTVYGPHGRPDMAPYIFTKSILENKEISVYGNGSSQRDFTYVSDIIRAIMLSIEKKTVHEIINLGNSHPISISQLIGIIEKATGKTAKIKYLPKNPYEMDKTFADISKAKKILGWQPNISPDEGIMNLVKWMKKSNL